MKSWEEYKVNIEPGESGNFSVERFEASEQAASFERIRAVVGGGRCVPAGTYTALYRKGGWGGKTLVMSDTRDEIYDLRGVLTNAHDHCLVAGLGLGVVVRAMLLDERVTKVTVLEISPDVIKLVGESLKAEFGDKLEIIEADALEWKPPKGVHYGTCWFDIWDDICADNLSEMSKLKRRYARKSDWKGCWCEYQCRRGRR